MKPYKKGTSMETTSKVHALHLAAAQSLRWRDLLELLASIRNLREPLTSPDGLRQAIALLVRLAELVGIDDAWTSLLRQIVVKASLFNLVLAIVKYLADVTGWDQSQQSILALSAEGEHVVVDAQSLVDWLPIVLEIIRLLKQIRGEQ
jgi:hypothetical protein